MGPAERGSQHQVERVKLFAICSSNQSRTRGVKGVKLEMSTFRPRRREGREREAQIFGVGVGVGVGQPEIAEASQQDQVKKRSIIIVAILFFIFFNLSSVRKCQKGMCLESLNSGCSALYANCNKCLACGSDNSGPALAKLMVAASWSIILPLDPLPPL